jgi:hypothetical protein
VEGVPIARGKADQHAGDLAVDLGDQRVLEARGMTRPGPHQGEDAAGALR